MSDENDVQIKRNKKRLEQIRGAENNERSTGDREHYQASGISVQTAHRPDQGDNGTLLSTDQGVPGSQGIARGTGEGIRPLDAESFDAAQGDDRVDQPDEELPGPAFTVELTEQGKKDRERELARQRKQRQRDREREAQNLSNFSDTLASLNGNSSSNRERDRDIPVTPQGYGNVTPLRQTVPDQSQNTQFRLRNPFKKDQQEKVKLFTNKEVEEEIERLADLYYRGSGLLDDILQIIVKGHEEVNIWQMDEEDAQMFAGMHLERAKRDEGAARSARKLLEIHDKLHSFLYFGPRTMATVQHVKEQGGFSFK